MDRLTRTLTGCSLAIVLSATGCRSTRPEVPPGPAYSNDGRELPKGGFGSDPHPAIGAPIQPYAQPGLPGTTGQFGTPAPGTTSQFGAPTGNTYGPPGSSPLGMAPIGNAAPGGNEPSSMPQPTAPPAVPGAN